MMPMQAMPIQAMPIQAMPIQAVPMHVKPEQPALVNQTPRVAAMPAVYRQTLSIDAMPAAFMGASGGFSHLRSICLEFPYEKLSAATADFHPSRLLGCGNAGSVYRAEMADGSAAAVKVIDLATLGDHSVIAGFEDEITILSKFRHPNLVVLMGWAQRGTRRFLVYEFLAGGDVSQRLEKALAPGGQPFLWQERLGAALDAATGLAYLHNATPRAFHRDIKSANILLSRGGAKMADFGISCIAKQTPVPGMGTAMLCKFTCGTPGYACPAYSQTGIITEGSEVYSFGIVLLELLLNRPPALQAGSPPVLTYPLLDVVRPDMPGGGVQRVMECLDVTARWPPVVAEALAGLAIRCTANEDVARPRFNEVCRDLRSIEEHILNQPALQQGSRIPETILVQKPSASMASDTPIEATCRLECVFSACLQPKDLVEIPMERRTILFDPAEPIVIGRQQQTDFFEAFLGSMVNFVSRNHFRIAATGKGTSSLLVTQLSENPVVLNGKVLSKGQFQCLNDGDTISLAMFENMLPDGTRPATRVFHDGRPLTPFLTLRLIKPELPPRATWKDFAGRKTGGDGYKFGDISRGVMKSIMDAL